MSIRFQLLAPPCPRKLSSFKHFKTSLLDSEFFLLVFHLLVVLLVLPHQNLSYMVSGSYLLKPSVAFKMFSRLYTFLLEQNGTPEHDEHGR